MNNILNIIFSKERITSSSVFLIYPDRNYALTYSELFKTVLGIAKELKLWGVKSGDRVLVHFDNSPESVILAFSLIIIGAVLVPVDPKISKDTLEYTINNSHCQYSIIINDNNINDTLLLKTIMYSNLINSCNISDNIENYSVDSEDEIVVLYSSGTTGNAKGIVFTYNSIINNFTEYGNAMGFNQSTRFLQVMPIFHADGWNFTLLMPYLFNSTVILTQKFDLKVCKSIFHISKEYKCNVLVAIPSILDSILYFSERYDYSELPVFDYVITSSEKLLKNNKESFENKFICNVFDLYGLTETGVISYYNKNIKWKEGSVGKLQNCVDVKFDIEGELYVKSPYLFKEYCNNESLTNKSKRKGWFHTGDFGYISDDGYLYLTDRKDNIINKGGEKIIPAEIDKVIMELPFINEVFTLGIDDEIYGQEIVSLVTLNDYGEITRAINSIGAYCAKNLRSNMNPNHILVVDYFPRNSVGKKDRFKIKEQIESKKRNFILFHNTIFKF